MIKKAAGLALTSLLALRHNRRVGESLHCEAVSRGHRCLRDDLKIFVLRRDICATIDSSGIDAIRGLFGPRVAFSFVCATEEESKWPFACRPWSKSVISDPRSAWS
jgi:hypothetical protein